MLSSFFSYNQNFVMFGHEHWTVLILTVALSIFLPLYAKKYLSLSAQINVSRFMAVLICFSVVFYIIVRMAHGYFDPKTDLPFDLCNIVGLILPFLMWRPSYRAHEILYFWILAGTLQGVLTPHLMDSFPTFTFFKFWITHSGLVIYTIYISVVFRFYPTRKSILRAFVAIQVYAVLMFLINLVVGSNYAYLLHKPPTASLLDLFGPWPWYILVLEALALVIFGLCYLPFWRAERAGRGGEVRG
jgi:hypothetical integral membrane protein (TIGR02206 family)